MADHADAPQTAYGFARLRKRYIRRAKYLTTSQEYLDRIGTSRRTWAEEFPDYRPGPANPIVASGMPANLERDYNDRAIKYANSRAAGDRFETAKDALDAMLEERESKLRYKEFRAHHRWFQLILDTAYDFFPLEDYPDPHTNSPHPACYFVCTCMGSDPKTLGDCDRFFSKFRLEIVARDSYDPDDDDVYSDADRDQAWYLRLYPGITEADLRESARAIASSVNDIYKTRTTHERITALHADGLTHRQIAHRLGVTVPTVSANLKSIAGYIPENS